MGGLGGFLSKISVLEELSTPRAEHQQHKGELSSASIQSSPSLNWCPQLGRMLRAHLGDPNFLTWQLGAGVKDF